MCPQRFCVEFGIQTGLASGRAGAIGSLATRRVRAGRSVAAKGWWDEAASGGQGL